MTKGSVKAFLERKNIEISAKRYGIDALSAMAQGLFCSLLIGTIINTIGTQFHIGFLTNPVCTIGGADYTVGGLAVAMTGPAMAIAIGYALKCPNLVLFSLATVGFAANGLGGAGGPLAVLIVAEVHHLELGLISDGSGVDISQRANDGDHHGHGHEQSHQFLHQVTLLVFLRTMPLFSEQQTL